MGGAELIVSKLEKLEDCKKDDWKLQTEVQTQQEEEKQG